jgi:uncharacterized membrane protein YphA (DoxX/SURF4 family)
MIDPLLPRVIAFGFAVLFIGAAWHKLSGLDRFEAILRDYHLLPAFASRPLTLLIPAIELTLGLGWVLGLLPRITALASAGLLAAYALAIGINLVRGRIYIDCGCGFGASTGKEQALSSSLVARNILLVGLTLLSLVPVAERDLGITDYGVVLAVLLTAILLYAGSGQLIKNQAAIMAWTEN